MQIKLKNKKILIPTILISSLLIILLVFGIGYSSYGNPSSSEFLNSIKQDLVIIKEANDSLNILTSVNPIDNELAKTKLPSSITKLTDVKNSLRSITPVSKYEDNKNTLIETLDYNINLYKQMSSILSNPKANDLTVSFDNLKSLKDKVITGYNGLTFKEIDFTLSKENTKTFEGFSIYTTNLISINKAIQNQKDHITNFISSTDSLIASFYDIKLNFFVYLADTRKSSDYATLIETIEDKEKLLASLIDKDDKLTVDEKTSSIHSSFGKILAKYKDYLNDFKFAVNNEKIQSTSDPAPTYDELDNLYEKPQILYKDISDSITQFSDDFSRFKKSIE